MQKDEEMETKAFRRCQECDYDVCEKCVEKQYERQ